MIDREGLVALIDALADDGFQIIGPQKIDGAIVYRPLSGIDDLPAGWRDEQDAGRYRLVPENGADGSRLFGYVIGPQGWKHYLYPPRQKLWAAHCDGGRDGGPWTVEPAADTTPHYAFLGVRPCELQAIAVQDRVFDNGQFADPGYLARRSRCFLIAVNCGRAAPTCFCASMGTGPAAQNGFDLALTEIVDDDRHDFLVEIGSDDGDGVMARVTHRPATDDDRAAAAAAVESARARMDRSQGGREMAADAAAVLRRNLEHRRWDDVAERCLSCGNCTMVCPTCFCSTVEDTTDLPGTQAERWRRWDSCFTIDFSYIHGGSVRRETRSRYRQWITHKLAHWHDQFGTSGCVGCGRCITWCPVGIDITEEARAIAESEGT